MKITEYVQFIAETIPEDALVVTSHTDNNSAWVSMKKPNGALLGLNMGFASPFGLGLALALPHRRVIILDSDGGVLLQTTALTDLAAQNPPNAIVVVHDNCSLLGVPTHTAEKADIAAMAKGAGIEHVCTVGAMGEFKAEFTKAMERKGLSYIVAKAEWSRVPGPKDSSKLFLLENTFQFIRYIEKTEGILIAPRGWRD